MINEKRLWYRQPASEWEEALPLGNGRLGAMVYGGIRRETIKLNEETLWSGYPRDKDIEDAGSHLETVRSLIKKGNLMAAQDHLEQTMLGEWNESYLPMADLHLDMTVSGDITNYRRELDLSTAIATTEFSAGGRRYKRETLISKEADALFCHIECDHGPIEIAVSLTSALRHSTRIEQDKLVLEGNAPSHVEPNYVESEEPIVYDAVMGMGFSTKVEVISDGADISYSGDTLTVRSESAITLVVFGRTGYRGYDRMPHANVIIEDQIFVSYEAIRQSHVALWNERYDRVALQIGTDYTAYCEDPTDVRLCKIQTPTYHDDGMIALLFHYGRYLLMSSSEYGGQPANLQGIWNEQLRAPWSSNWTVNINTQMNYWPAEVCGLEEFHEPLFSLIEDISMQGRKTSQVQYGTRGWVSHHNVDLWRQTSQVGKHEKSIRPAQYAFWPMSGVWLCQHLWDHYDYSRDLDFLRARAYPVIEGAVEFVLDWLVEDEEGRLMTMPSTSPENNFIYDGEACSITSASTMDNALIRELMERFLRMSEMLKIDGILQQHVKEAIIRIAGYRIGRDGSLQEWFEDYEEYDAQHRHMSHLVGLYPGSDMFRQQGLEKNLDACLVSLQKKGEDSVGWSLAWKVALYARLQDGDSAYRLIRRQLKQLEERSVEYHSGGSYPNLFAAHPPFQIDANFGVTAGIAEMLIQSHNEAVVLLPAVPEHWSSGRLRGLRARGGFEVSVSWDNGMIEKASVCSGAGEKLILISNNPLIGMDGDSRSEKRDGKFILYTETEKGKVYRFRADER